MHINLPCVLPCVALMHQHTGKKVVNPTFLYRYHLLSLLYALFTCNGEYDVFKSHLHWTCYIFNKLLK